MNRYINLTIGPDGKLALNGLELKNVTGYTLKHSAAEMAELTITMAVSVNEVDSKPEGMQVSLEKRIAEIERQVSGMGIKVDIGKIRKNINTLDERQGYDFKQE